MCIQIPAVAVLLIIVIQPTESEFLDSHALDANGDLQLLELLLGARLRLLHLLGKLQLPNGLLDHLDALGLVHAQVTKELKG